jgi:muramoyltetrapeptide carboxypeptidase
MNTPIPFLHPGDLISILAPAKSIDKELVLNAVAFFESKGYQVEVGEHCTGEFNYFSGTDEARTADFQKAIDNPKVKAIICARGGYGSIRILDRLNWAAFLREPKWIVGFSDITVFHQHIQCYDLPSIHATMPKDFGENTTESFDTLLDALEGRELNLEIPSSHSNKLGKAEGILLGGNLSIIHGLIGTDAQPDYTDSILFIEDLSEQLYHIDRMFYSLVKAGILDKIKGLIVGGMTDMKDTLVPFGQTLEEIICSHFTYRKIPITFQFPAGHIADNRAIIFGKKVELNVTSNLVYFRSFAF